ncbi:MAG TPA: MmgE/PrpD family protein [Thermoanaerobaculales bacterium]|nr:MmgE/PrpD family protein [Thermoanaerobaculales bacterium]HQN97478.1 MmgE/PrpD family protein [Thermoanaerobaculales bacterium]HQP44568.1 MmgE/PrpD family protein [Thermoanaerobaculales bacterium]
MPNVTRTIAEWAATTRYEDLPTEVVAEAKRFLMDSVGCALGGAQQHDVHLARAVLAEIAGRGQATVLVTGERWDPVSAALLNALMIRVMDYNDIYWKQDPSHPSDLIPAAMAAAERAGGSGRDLLLGIVLAYEFEQRLCEVSFPGVRELGWHHATLTAAAAPIAAGRMLGLDAAQIQHAIGISASRHCTTGSVTAGKLTMMKNTVDPLATQSGVLAALLAEQGYTGPEHVLDGKEGFSHVFDSEWKFDVLTGGLGSSWRILQCGMKFFPTEALTHAPISATLDLVAEHDLAPDEIETVTIHSLARAADILADPSKYDPHTKETADHSLPYVIAAAIADRQVTPLQFTAAKIMDPTIRAQLAKVKVIADPEIEAVFPALQRVRVEIATRDGRLLARQLDYPKGDPRNPLTDAEIASKFTALAEGIASAGDVERMQRAIAHAEEYDDARELMGELVVKG